MVNLVEIVSKQNEVIKEQSDIIDELFRLLMQHMAAEEACRTQAYADMKIVSRKIDEVM